MSSASTNKRLKFYNAQSHTKYTYGTFMAQQVLEVKFKYLSIILVTSLWIVLIIYKFKVEFIN